MDNGLFVFVFFAVPLYMTIAALALVFLTAVIFAVSFAVGAALRGITGRGRSRGGPGPREEGDIGESGSTR